MGRYPSREQLLDEACGSAGLDDFGPGDFVVGLDVLLESLDRDAGLDPSTDDGVLGLIRRRLVNRLRLEQWWADHGDIGDVPVQGPVDVIGLPRTGTTALGNMLSLDPRFHGLSMWEQTEPVPPPIGGAEQSDPRRIAQLAADAAVPPELHAMHLYEIDAAAEDSEVLGMAFHGQQMTLPVWGYHDWWRRADHVETFRYHRRVIQVLGSRRDRRIWLFKSPHHKFHPEAVVDAYPEVRFVMCHRDPAKVVPSYSSLVSSIFPQTTEPLDPHRVGREISEHLRIGIEMHMDARRRMGTERFLDIHHRETIDDPVGVIRRVQAFVGLDPDDAVDRSVRDYQDRNRTGARGAHSYTAEQFGLTVDRIRSDFDSYIHDFDIDLEH